MNNNKYILDQWCSTGGVSEPTSFIPQHSNLLLHIMSSEQIIEIIEKKKEKKETAHKVATQVDQVDQSENRD